MSAFDCQACGACCREAFDAVEIDPADAFVDRHPEQVVITPFGKTGVRRNGDRCACLAGSLAGGFVCAVYADRPQTCRDVEPGGEACLFARQRVGIDGSTGRT